jgi:hypothetical protein
MAQAVRRRTLPTEVRIRAQAGKVVMGQIFSPKSLLSPVNIIPPWLSIPLYITWGIKNKGSDGCCLATQSHPTDTDIIDINNDTNTT